MRKNGLVNLNFLVNEQKKYIYLTCLPFQGGLQSLLGYIKDKDLDRVSVGQASSLDTVAKLELLQVIMIFQQIPDRPKF